jgi:hypothetical protein
MLSGSDVTGRRRDPRRPARRGGVPIPAACPRIRGRVTRSECDVVPRLPPGWLLGEHEAMRSPHRVPIGRPGRPTGPQCTGEHPRSPDALILIDIGGRRFPPLLKQRVPSPQSDGQTPGFVGIGRVCGQSPRTGREGPFFRVRRGLFAPSLLSNSARIVGGDRKSTTRPHPARSHQLIVRSGLPSSHLCSSVTRIRPEQARMHQSQFSPHPPSHTIVAFFAFLSRRPG